MTDMKEQFYEFLKKHRVYRRYHAAYKLQVTPKDAPTVKEFLNIAKPRAYFTEAFVFTKEKDINDYDITYSRFWHNLNEKWLKIVKEHK